MAFLKLSVLVRLDSEGRRITRPLYVEASEIRVLETGSKNPNGASIYILSLATWREVEESCEEIIAMIQTLQQEEQEQEEQEEQENVFIAKKDEEDFEF